MGPSGDRGGAQAEAEAAIAVGARPSNFRRNCPRSSHSTMTACRTTDAADNIQTYSSRAQGCIDSQIAGPAKVIRRLALPIRAGRVSPSAWKVPDAVKIRAEGRKFS